MNCKNCNGACRENYCSLCGQKSSVNRIDLSYLLTEVASSIFQVDRGFLYTIKELLFRPGHSIREFLLGKRVKHYKPVGFLLITSTIYVFSAYLMERNTFIYDLALGFEEGAIDADSGSEIESSLGWLSKYQVYIPLLILPLFSFSSYIAFIRSEYNYFEHLVINFYITGQQMIIYWLFGFLFFKENVFMVTPIFIGIAYNFWSYSQIFDHIRAPARFGKIILSYAYFIGGLLVAAFICIGILKAFS